ncbi:MAG: hypothetical protein GY875_13610 [Gammaproteobacteria bacterium]|nr:hypothetical protein [Gammaproteobacteria bacterium]
MAEYTILIFRCLTLVVLVGFLPVCAYTYYTYRIGQRKLEIKRILRVLDIQSEYRDIYVQDIGRMHFFVAVMFTMSIATAGLAALLLSNELHLAETPSLLLSGSQVTNLECGPGTPCLEAYQHGALLAFGLGFLGAYIWGLQGIFKRYSMNDLMPIAFYHFGLRMLLSSFFALLIYHAVGGFNTDISGAKQDSQTLLPTSDGMLIILVFLVGMFPQQGLRWLKSKVGFNSEGHPSVRPLPLNMIEGMTSYDIYRLEELGIDTCYDLANADFVPLLLKTSYGSRELIDWLLQAKLCVRFGDGTFELRERGIRTVTDFAGLDDAYLETLAKETSLMLPSLKQATQMSVSDSNIDRLKRAAERLGHYWEGDNTEAETETDKG